MASSDDDILKHAAEHFRKMSSQREPSDIPPEEMERRGRTVTEKEVEVAGVYQYQDHGGGNIVLLRDRQGRSLTITIGEAEALSIALALQGATARRPLTHDLVRNLCERLSATVEYIVIDDLYDDTYYGQLGIRHEALSLEVDCRPSDGIALALRFKAPIYVADHLLQEPTES